MRVVDTITATLLEGAGHPLTHLDGQVTLDESWAPYARATLTVAAADAVALDLLDAREPRRVAITATTAYPASFMLPRSRTFDLGLREATPSGESGTVALALASDEALLMDDILAATSPLSMHAHQGSLRALCSAVLARIGASLEPGSVDAAVPAMGDATNLMTNPSAEVSLAGVGASFCSASRSNAWAAPGAGSWSFALSGTFGADSYIDIGGNDTALRLGMQAGKTYRAEGTIRLAAPVGSSTGDARRIRIVGRDAAGSPVEIAKSSAAPDAAGVTRLSVTFTIPKGYTGAATRWYHGGSSGTVWWDALSLREVDPTKDDPTDVGYFDGATTDTVDYGFAWSGVAHESASTRVQLNGSGPALLYWRPGVSAWAFLQPLFQARGFRLFCDEARNWYLVDGATFTAPGSTQLSMPGSLHSADSRITRDSEDWFDAAVVRYRWRTDDGSTREAIDVHAPPGSSKVRVFDMETPYPGPGFAAYAVKRAEGLGRTATVAALADLRVSPSQVLKLDLPNLPQLLGAVRSVVFALGDATMVVRSRGLADLGPDSILAIPDAYQVVDLPGTIATLTPSAL